MNRTQLTTNYTNQRLSTRRDDRQTQEKLAADARLRGSLGTHRANAVIAAMDNLKSRGLA